MTARSWKFESSPGHHRIHWGADRLSAEQIRYAAADVVHLHAIRAVLDAMLLREGRSDLAAACFAFLPDRAALDLGGWEDTDIFAH